MEETIVTTNGHRLLLDYCKNLKARLPELSDMCSEIEREIFKATYVPAYFDAESPKCCYTEEQQKELIELENVRSNLFDKVYSIAQDNLAQNILSADEFARLEFTLYHVKDKL